MRVVYDSYFVAKACPICHQYYPGDCYIEGCGDKDCRCDGCIIHFMIEDKD